MTPDAHAPIKPEALAFLDNVIANRYPAFAVAERWGAYVTPPAPHDVSVQSALLDVDDCTHAHSENGQIEAVTHGFYVQRSDEPLSAEDIAYAATITYDPAESYVRYESDELVQKTHNANSEIPNMATDKESLTVELGQKMPQLPDAQPTGEGVGAEETAAETPTPDRSLDVIDLLQAVRETAVTVGLLDSAETPVPTPILADGGSGRDTRPKGMSQIKHQVWDWCDAHRNETLSITIVADGTGIPRSTAGKALKLWREWQSVSNAG